MKNIDKVHSNGLCMGCGICAGICPNDAISMVKDKKNQIYIPKIDKNKCTNCGLCLKSCPGIAVNFKRLNLSIFGKEPENKLIGNYLQCYIGYTTHKKLRYASSSGGIVTQILISLLENKTINGALVVRMKNNNPLEAESFIARTKEEIISARGSKYCPVTINAALEKINNSNEREKFAVVGLPCHIHGIRKSEEIFPNLKKKIIFHVGIFCSHTPSFKATDNFINKKLRICDKNIRKLDYRGSGWPGYLEVLKKDGEKLKISLFNYWRFIGANFFAIPRCKLCIDETAELADISCGDAWLPEFSGDNIGTSVIVARTHDAEKRLNFLKNIGAIYLKKINADKVIQSQHSVLSYKKIIVPYKIKIRKIFLQKNPIYSIKFLKPKFRYFFRIIRNKIFISIYELYLIYFK
jgi:coenzyme F420 hydrogenase subunit beta